MSQPTPYARQYNFIDYQTVNPTLPLPADQVEAEYNAVKLTLDQTLQNLAAIQRDDGKLGNLTVHPESLDAAVLSLIGSFTFRGAWLTATAFAVKDMVTQGGNAYVAILAHTSGVFATDLAANKWMILTKTGIAPDGSVTPTANLPMGGFKFTGLGNGSARSDSINLGQAQDMSIQWGAVSGTANAIVLTMTPPITVYVAGQTTKFKATANNSGATTINYGGGILALQQNGAALVGGEIKIGRSYETTYDGTAAQLTTVAEATETLQGSAEIATQAEVVAGTDDARIITPLKLSNLTATESVRGIVAVATQAQVDAGAIDTRFVSPLKLWTTPIRGGWRNIAGPNGGLEVFSRGTSIAVAASTVAYGPDRFYISTNANQASVISQQPGLTNQSRFCARIQRNAGQTGIGSTIFGFPLDADEVYRLRGKKVSIRITARGGANWSPVSGHFDAYLVSGTAGISKRLGGYAGETTVVVASGTNATAGGAAVVGVGVSAAIFPLTGTCAELQLGWVPVGTAGANDYLEIDDIEIRADEPVIDQFERRPVAEEQLSCERHVLVLGGNATNEQIGVGRATTTTVAEILVQHPVDMRAAPTGVTVANAANFRIRRGNTTVACTAIAFVSAGPKATLISATVAAGLTANEAVSLETNNTNCQIVFTGAEI